MPPLHRFAFCLLLLIAPGTTVNALDGAAGDADAQAIQRVISRQIAAFRRDDGPAAFSHAAPNIRRMFVTAERFMRMVRSAYSPVYRPRRVVFGKLHIIDGKGVQQVNLIGPDGVEYVALYEMFRRGDGAWLIAGVALLKGRSRDI